MLLAVIKAIETEERGAAMRSWPASGTTQQDAAFDEYIAAGLAPWLVARIGEGLESAPSGNPTLPPNALDVPRLEGDFLLNTLSGVPAEWFLPEFAPAAADPVFSFAVTQTGEVAENGRPFNRAILTLSLRAVAPANLAAFSQAGPFRPVPDLGLGPTVTVPITAQDGSVQLQAVPGTATTAADGRFVATFNLTGPVVEAAYVHLNQGGGAGLKLTATYTGLITETDAGFPVHGPDFRGYQFQLFGDGTTPGTIEPVNPMPGVYWFFPVTAAFVRTVPVGLAFGTDTYRSRFTLTAKNMTRPIIDADDLR